MSQNGNHDTQVETSSAVERPSGPLRSAATRNAESGIILGAGNASGWRENLFGTMKNLSAKAAGALALTAGLFGAASDAQAQDVLLLNYTNSGVNLTYNNDIVNKLNSTGLFDQVDVATAYVGGTQPDLAFLSNYDAVLITANLYHDRQIMGDTIADYFDAGGGVVCAFFETADGNTNDFFLGGRWESENYHALTRATSYPTSQLYETPATPLVKLDATHPIFDGVDTFLQRMTTQVDTPIEPGAIRLADFGNGAPAIVVKPIGGRHVVDLAFWPVSSDGGPANHTWEADTPEKEESGARLLANALLFSMAGPANTPPRRQQRRPICNQRKLHPPA